MELKYKAKPLINNSLALIIVPTTGFEPAHLLAPPPQDGVSTNFTTWAQCVSKDNSFDKLLIQT
jgi:hypothetical protein